jgi:acyl-CoA synthetase (NDP forming)
LAKHELAGLVSPRLPLDLTPMADEAAFLSAVDVLLANAAVVVVGFVPFTRRLDSSAGGGAMLADALAQLRNAHAKPVGVVIDAGPEYEDYRRAFDDAGLPVFARMENALVGLQVLA